MEWRGGREVMSLVVQHETDDLGEEPNLSDRTEEVGVFGQRV